MEESARNELTQAANEALAEELPVLPLALRLTYPWLREEDPRAER